MHRPLLAALMTAGIAGGTPPGQSFDCAKAATPTEKRICADPELSGLDRHLARYYEGAKLALTAGTTCLQTSQREWLRDTRDRCAGAACLKAAYLNRLGELHDLQPGVSAITAFDLPRGQRLVWIVPPSLDQVAAPARPDAKPLEAVGTLVDTLAENPSSADYGFELRTRSGTVHPLIPLMFLEAPAADRISRMAQAGRNSTFRLRGYAARDENGRTYFEPSRCVFIYRAR